MSPDPQVSIVIPCYNASTYISGLAASLGRLKGEAVELIFVDDGSIDGTAAAIRLTFPGAVCIDARHRGVASARNAGVHAARGRYIQLLDADDTIQSGKLCTQIAAMEKTGAAVGYCDWQMVVHAGNDLIEEEITRAGNQDDMVAALLAGWWVPPNAYLIDRAAYLAIGGSDDSLTNAQDFDLVLRLAMAGYTFHYCPGHFASYHRYMDRTSLARGDRRTYWRDTEKVVRKAVSQLDSRGDSPAAAVRRRSAAIRLHAVARNVYDLDRQWYAELLQEVRRLDPGFAPSGSRLYRGTAAVIGLESAETLAALKRTWTPKRSSQAPC